MLSVIYGKFHLKLFTLSVIMMNVVMLSVVVPLKGGPLG